RLRAPALAAPSLRVVACAVRGPSPANRSAPQTPLQVLANRVGHVGLDGLLEGQRRPGDEGLAPDRAVAELAHRAVRAGTGIGVEDHLALDAQIPDDPRRQILRDLVRAVHAPELRHEEARGAVKGASGTAAAEGAA